jgi:hypothetical protein
MLRMVLLLALVVPCWLGSTTVAFARSRKSPITKRANRRVRPTRRLQVVPARKPLEVAHRASPRSKSPRFKSPRFKSPRFKSPRFKGPRSKSPRFKGPRSKSPRFKGPRFEGSSSGLGGSRRTRARQARRDQRLLRRADPTHVPRWRRRRVQRRLRRLRRREGRRLRIFTSRRHRGLGLGGLWRLSQRSRARFASRAPQLVF